MTGTRVDRDGPGTPRVLMVTGAYYPEITGGARQCQTLIEALRDRVSFCVLSVSNDPSLSSPDLVEGITVYRVHADPVRWTEKIRGALRVVRLLFDVRAHLDLVHLHGFTQKSILLIGLAKLLRKPLIMTPGGLGQDDPDTIRHRGWLFWGSYRMVDRFIALSPAFERVLLGAGLSESRIHRIPNGVDLRRFRRATELRRGELRTELGLPADATIILFVGMMAAVKRPDVLFEAWSRLGEQLTSRSALVFCPTRSGFGEIDPAIAATIRMRAAALGLDARVRFAEPTSEIERYFGASDIFVLSSAREGLPNALLEAMASGLACIASQLPGITDTLIESGVNGLLVESGDMPSLRCALQRLLQRPDEARAFGARARATIEESYGITDTAARILDLYCDLLGQKFATPASPC